jgi:hypothetical protein
VTLTDLLRRTEKLVIDNSPALMTAVGVVGTLTTAYLSGRASYRMGQRFAYEDMEYLEPTPRNRKKEIFFEEKLWKLYIPAMATAVLSVTAIVFANRVGSRRAAAMAVAYSVTEKAFEEYKDKIKERFGTAKEQSVRDELAQERITKDPVGGREVVLAGNGDVLCYDLYTGRYFQSNHEVLRRAANDVNAQIIHEMSASLTDFYNAVGLKSTAISDQVGWNVDRMLELRFTTALSDDNKPCLAVGFAIAPIPNYYKIN